MAPRLRVLAGTSPSTMIPITPLVNTDTPHRLSSPLFEGQIVAHIAGLTDEEGRKRDSEYFKREDRSGVTWSIQVQGRFLVPYSADDILFGNTFDRPLKLPWGTSAILKFMHFIDPTLDHDLLSKSKPWALSPLIATMPYFTHKRLSSSSSTKNHKPSFPSTNNNTLPPFPSPTSLKDDTSELHRALIPTLGRRGNSGSSEDGSDSADERSSTRSGGSSGTASSVGTRRSAGGSSMSSVGSGASNGSGSASGSSGGRFKAAMKKVTGGASKKGNGDKDCEKDEAKMKRARVEKEVKELKTSSDRRGYFSAKDKRKDVVFGPEDVITTDFCYGFINFSPSLSLALPGGLSLDLMKYWDGQPVRFVCCERKGSGSPSNSDSESELGSGDGSESDSDASEGGSSNVPWGRVFWCVAIEMADE